MFFTLDCHLSQSKNNRFSMHLNTFIKELLGEEKASEVIEAARTSMGMDISDLDLINIERFATRVASLSECLFSPHFSFNHRNLDRVQLHHYVKDRMNSCAPSLSALIGEQV